MLVLFLTNYIHKRYKNIILFNKIILHFYNSINPLIHSIFQMHVQSIDTYLVLKTKNVFYQWYEHIERNNQLQSEHI